jgi:hypothetical protein
VYAEANTLPRIATPGPPGGAGPRGTLCTCTAVGSLVIQPLDEFLLALLAICGSELVCDGMAALTEGSQTPLDGEADMTFTADPRVDAYIDALPQWQQAICEEVRELVHAADPDVVETIKRTVQPYFVLEGNICALLAAKDHVNVFLYDGGIVPDPDGIITGGHDNKTARTVAVRKGETLNARALMAMFEQIIANNQAGGWRKLKPER